jgi:platelet-activating factor acetylhydrolase IB subunit beta/gamma
MLALFVTLSQASLQVSRAQECPDSAATTTLTPAYNNDGTRAAIFQTELKSIAAQASIDENVDIILIGDSLIEGWNVKLLLPSVAINFGVGGDQTQTVLWRLQDPVLNRLKPRNAVILLGTNNIAAGNSACAIASGLKDVVIRSQKIWPQAKIWLIEIPPRGDKFASRDDIRLEINKQLRSFTGVWTINVDDELNCHGRTPCVNYLDDKLHFSPAGYGVLTSAVRAAMR